MNKDEFKQIRQALKWNGETIARKLGIKIGDAHAYENGKKSIPSEIERYLRAINPKQN